MPELDTITVEGFKSIAKVENLKLGAINVVIGANGSGKSNFIGVFSFLHAIRDGKLQDYVAKAGGAEKILHFGSKRTDRIRIEISFADGITQYEVKLNASDADELFVSSESYRGRMIAREGSNGQGATPAGNETLVQELATTRVAEYVRKHLDRWRLHHFHDTSSTSPMKKTADVEDNRFLRPDGSNLASFLYYLQEKQHDSYTLIRKTVQRVAPFFDNFQLAPSKLNPGKIRLEWRHKESDAYFDASSLSDGTLRFIALATLFLQPEGYRPSVILVDEPELGLHPYAITMLASLVKQASQTTQVILSTQSPLLLDHFEPEDVLVTDRVGGGTQFTRLSADSLASWLVDYSLGQLWEKNEFGGRPKG